MKIEASEISDSPQDQPRCLFLRLECAFETLSNTRFGKGVALTTSRILSTTPAISEPSVLARTTIRRRPFSRAIWFGPSVSSTVAMRFSGTRPLGVFNQEFAQASCGPVGF